MFILRHYHGFIMILHGNNYSTLVLLWYIMVFYDNYYPIPTDTESCCYSVLWKWEQNSKIERVINPLVSSILNDKDLWQFLWVLELLACDMLPVLMSLGWHKQCFPQAWNMLVVVASIKGRITCWQKKIIYCMWFRIASESSLLTQI